ncbi:hypothetical protein BAUCODRAFT_32677 [Baudoinia panamericana UAMH 10762]|uniref:SAP domain-containing protein n=1 Tax=Baudoinia panamericana (strain UAMH 10762) TaxID=717646 RepID=M2NDD8_BAUPA|nr:uncharacterized protein BAUCODRAFT_32677 [Baudoinia panamericana UAMH 10762]EMC96930.1 hypothetical protein BAUCODRAFT_32677 [Baudoinia panamericana UAMH 10762]
MASGGHILQQQKPAIETQLKRLLNTDLKDLCRSYGKPVSGNKAELQKRCIEILNEIVAKGDPAAFEAFRYRANHKGQSPPLTDIVTAGGTYDSPSGGHGSHSMATGRGYGMSTQNRMPTGGKYFKSSPFYEVLDTVVHLQDLPDMPQNRNTVRATINLSVEQAQRMTSDGDMRLMMFCGAAQEMSPYHPVDIAFPNQIEVKINNDDVKSNFKGLKNKPGSTKPADLTSKVRARANYPNQVSITYALTTKRYAFVVYLVRYVNAATLTERIRTASVIPKERVLAEMQKANADPDIEATAIRMSLKDPVSTVRITLPVRSTVCTHTQCFDGAMFMQLVEQAPQWSCPVCNKTVSFQSLCVDKYFEDILNRTPKSVEKVDVEPDGQWKIIKDEDDEQPAGGAGKARASYDDDFDDDDDLVEMPDPTNKPINSVKQESQPLSAISPVAGQSFAVNTPPLSSREPSVAQSAASGQRSGTKRSAGAVIDLTLSDEEDEPPRPAKRHHPAPPRPQNQGNQHVPTPSYHTPASLPDSSRYQPAPPPPSMSTSSSHAFRGADTYRPSTDHYRPSPLAGHASTSLSPQQAMRQPPMMNGTSTSTYAPSNPHSPVLPQAYSGNAAHSRPPAPPWPSQQYRPPSLPQINGNQSFAMRPTPSPLGFGTASPQPQYDGGNGQYDDDSNSLALPPLQQHNFQDFQQDGSFWGWRGDQTSNYTNSPG